MGNEDWQADPQRQRYRKGDDGPLETEHLERGTRSEIDEPNPTKGERRNEELDPPWEPCHCHLGRQEGFDEEANHQQTEGSTDLDNCW